MSNDKPLFIFFAMTSCGHCTNFKSGSVWPKLLRDPEVQAVVSPVQIEWGFSKKSDGTLENRPLAQQYKFVNYGPYFYIHESDNPANGTEMKNVNREDFDSMKSWIIATGKKHSKKTKTAVTATPQERVVTPKVFNPTQFKKLPESVKVAAGVESTRPTRPPQNPPRQRGNPRQTSPTIVSAMAVESTRETSTTSTPFNADKFATKSAPKGKIVPKVENTAAPRKFIARNKRNL
jgi:hypothetical protein